MTSGASSASFACSDSSNSSSTSSSSSSSSSDVVREVLASGHPHPIPSPNTHYILELVRYTIAGHAHLPAHYHPGTQIEYIQAGTLHYTVVSCDTSTPAPAIVTRAFGSRIVVNSGESIVLTKGDSIEEPGGMIHYGINNDDEPVICASASLFDATQPKAIMCPHIHIPQTQTRTDANNTLKHQDREQEHAFTGGPNSDKPTSTSSSSSASSDFPSQLTVLLSNLISSSDAGAVASALLSAGITSVTSLITLTHMLRLTPTSDTLQLQGITDDQCLQLWKWAHDLARSNHHLHLAATSIPIKEDHTQSKT